MAQNREPAALSTLEAVAPERGPHLVPHLPPGRHRISHDFVLQHQRTRIIDALAEEIVATGYRDVTVADIVKRAGVARNTFYKIFANKEECFLAAADVAGQEAMRRIAAAVAAAGDTWAEHVRAGIGEFLAFASSESSLARVFIVDSLSAGPEAADRYERTVKAIVPLLRLGRKDCANGAVLPDTLEETIIGGIFWIVYQRIALGRPEELRETLPEMVEFALTPYLGFESARQVAAGEPPC